MTTLGVYVLWLTLIGITAWALVTSNKPRV